MATVVLPVEVQSIVDDEVREHGFAGAAEYLTSLVLRDQKRRAKEQLEAFLTEGVDSGDYVEMTSAAWQDLRRTLHEQTGTEYCLQWPPTAHRLAKM